MRIASCIPVFSTGGKGALGPLLSDPAGASKRDTPTSNLTESTALVELRQLSKLYFYYLFCPCLPFDFFEMRMPSYLCLSLQKNTVYKKHVVKKIKFTNNKT